MNTDQLIQLIPKASLWAEDQENIILTTGIALSSSQLEDAKKVHVNYPEKVRLLRVKRIPLPEDPELNYAAQAIKLLTPDTVGLTFRYGIFIRNDFWDNRRTIVHELVHTSQYERSGGILPFLQNYLMECITIGYPAAPMEQEAIRISNEITT